MAPFSEFFTGSPERNEQRSTLRPEQENLYRQMLNANQYKGSGGSFGQSADYYRDLLDPNSQTAQQMFAPEMRRFNEQIIPGISEQFAGMGSGGLSSSGFRNAAVSAGADLSERLGAIRAQLRQQGAQGLMNMGQFGLNPYAENITRPGTEGFLSQAAPAIGAGIGGLIGGPVGAGIGLSAGSAFRGKGQSSPYGSNSQQRNPGDGELGWGQYGLYPKQGNYNPYTDEMK